MTNYEPVDYNAVLADLEAKKAAIEKMIEHVKVILGLGVMVGVAVPEANGKEARQAPQEVQETDGSAFLGMSTPEAIRKYLRGVKRKQSTTEIADAL